MSIPTYLTNNLKKLKLKSKFKIIDYHTILLQNIITKTSKILLLQFIKYK